MMMGAALESMKKLYWMLRQDSQVAWRSQGQSSLLSAVIDKTFGLWGWQASARIIVVPWLSTRARTTALNINSNFQILLSFYTKSTAYDISKPHIVYFCTHLSYRSSHLPILLNLILSSSSLISHHLLRFVVPNPRINDMSSSDHSQDHEPDGQAMDIVRVLGDIRSKVSQILTPAPLPLTFIRSPTNKSDQTPQGSRQEGNRDRV